MDKEHILREIKRLAAENQGIAPGVKLFTKETGIKNAAWLGKFWARWSDAVREAGLEPQQLQGSMATDEKILGHIELIRHYGKWPTSNEVRLYVSQTPGFPGHNTILGLGTVAERMKLVREFCEERREEFKDVLDALPAEAFQGEESQDSAFEQLQEKNWVQGYVYLMKSGKYHKIGRSVSVERRHRDLAIQLPEELKVIHEIATDDPVGIEAYWHKRFKEQRLNGEWFNLGADDINAFKRRRYM